MKIQISTLLSLFLVLAFADECEPGTFKVKAGVCRPCPKGTFQANKNRYACRPCPLRRVSTEVGSTACTKCPEGSIPNEHQSECICAPRYVQRRGKCVPCKPGTFFVEGRNSRYCDLCKAGEYQPKAGQTKCLKCPEGSNSGDGATECITCKNGEGFNKLKMTCETCKAGFYYDEYSGCLECHTNEYKPQKGNGPCLPCPIGSHSRPGARKCLSCPEGTSLFKNGECGVCPAGSYFDQYRRICYKCGYNEFTPFKNVLNSCYDCNGKNFALKGSTKCVSCPKHTFLFRDGNCKECPLGSVHLRDKLICQKCGVNQFSRGNMDSCEFCPSGAYSLPGATTCFACPEDEALILKKKRCGSCPPGKSYDSSKGKCKKCYAGSIKRNAGVNEDCTGCDSGRSNKERTKCID